MKLEIPEDPLRASLPYGILPALVCFIAVFIRSRESAAFPFDLRFLPVGMLIGFLLIPIHEFLHAVCYPKEATV